MGSPRRSLVWLLAGLTGLNLTILVIRIVSMVHYARLVPMPIEGPGIYGFWKIQHGWPLYEWPYREFFALTLYNFLFYQVYARVLGLFGIDGEWMPVAARFVTLAFACVGCWVQYRVMALLLGGSAGRNERVMWFFIAAITWFGTGLTGPWATGIRPDVPAVALSLAGLYVAVAGEARARRTALIGAGVLFYLAWAFKQSQVGLFAGVVAYFLIWRRSIADACRIAVPFVVLAAATVAVGGAAYRANIIGAAAVGDLIPWLAIHSVRSIFLPQLLIWLLPVWMLATVRIDGRPALDSLRDIVLLPERLSAVLARPLEIVVFAAGGAAASGFVLLAKAGSSENHAIEFSAAASVLCGVAMTVPLSERASRRRDIAAILLVAPMILYAAATLAGDRGAPAVHALRLYASGEQPLRLSADEYGVRLQAERDLRALPKPVYVDDEIFGQPWFATDNQYPAVVLDHVYYDAAARDGVIVGGIENLIRRRHFASLVLLTPPWYLERLAIQSGYVRAGTTRFAGVTRQILVRSGDPRALQQPSDQRQYPVPQRRAVR